MSSRHAEDDALIFRSGPGRPRQVGRGRPDRGRLSAGIVGVAVLTLSLLVGPAAPAQAWTVLCTGFTRCAGTGYPSFGYDRVHTQSFWSQNRGHNCTNYVAYRMIQSGMSSTWPGARYGNARDWGTIFADRMDPTPTVGSVAWWGTEYSSSGHVAYVEKVISATELIISEDNWGGDFRWRKVVRGSDKWPKGFIHFRDRAGTPGYQPLTPTRILDTRVGLGVSRGQARARSALSVVVAGKAGVPASGATSVVLNVTAVNPAGGGYLTAYPSGASRPTASNVNYVRGQTVANQVLAGVGSDGRVKVSTSNTAHVVIDVAGYYSRPGNYTALRPGRVLDTRSGLGARQVRIPAGGRVDVQVAGRQGVPTRGAAAVALNVTALKPGGEGYVTAWSTGSTRPTTSSLNYVKGLDVAGLVVAKIGTGGKVSLRSSAATDLIADVQGWYPAGSDYTGTAPSRLVDTRTGLGGRSGILRAGGAITVLVAGRGGIPRAGVVAVMLTVTAVDPDRGGYLAAYPGGASRPVASTVNFPAQRAVANSTLAKLGSNGTVLVYSSAPAGIVVDVQGYVTR